ncbi:MAG TPA: acetyltransferase [Bacillota bacterium]|nr:acetyltransferase [Bacillota bacterium]
MKTLCIYGSGGMGREIVDLAYKINKWSKIVFVDDSTTSSIIDGIDVFTLDKALSQFASNPKDSEFIVAVGQPSSRRALYERLKQHNLNCISVIYPGFDLSRLSSIQSGCIVHTGTTITVNVHIGRGCLVNKHVVIGHDVDIGDYTVISPNASIGGDVSIGAGCFLGSGAIIRNGINIGENSVIGMGAVVLKDVKPNSVMVGNPARFLKSSVSKINI